MDIMLNSYYLSYGTSDLMKKKTKPRNEGELQCSSIHSSTGLYPLLLWKNILTYVKISGKKLHLTSLDLKERKNEQIKRSRIDRVEEQ